MVSKNRCDRHKAAMVAAALARGKYKFTDILGSAISTEYIANSVRLVYEDIDGALAVVICKKRDCPACEYEAAQKAEKAGIA